MMLTMLRSARPSSLTVLLVGISLAVPFLVLLRIATDALTLSSDSMLYLSTASSLVDGNGWYTNYGTPYNGNGPLYPLTVAVFARLLRVEATQAAGYVNAVAFGLVVWFTAMWVKNRVRSQPLVLWATCACAFAAPLTQTSVGAGTTMLFISCSAAFLFALDRFVATGRQSISLLVAAATAAAAGGLTRYVGICLVGIGLLILLVHKGNTASRTDKKRNIAVWLGVAATPIVAWAMRDLIGPGAFYSVGLHGLHYMSSLHAAAGAVAQWVYGDVAFNWLNGLAQRLAGVSLVADARLIDLVVTSALLIVPAVAAGHLLAKLRPGFLARSRAGLTVPLIFVSGYVCFLTVVLYMTVVPFVPRYLVPIYPPLLVAVTVLLDEVVSGSRKQRASSKAMSRGMGSILWTWLLLQAWPTNDELNKRTILGYASEQWTDSETLHWLVPRIGDVTIRTSSPGAFYFVAGSTDRVTGLGRDWSRLRPTLLAASETGEEVLVAVFYRDFWRYRVDYGLDDLGDLPGFDVVAILEDGIVFGNAKSPGASHTSSKTLFHDVLPSNIPFKEGYEGRGANKWRLVGRWGFDVHVSEQERRLFYVQNNCTAASDPGPRKRDLPVHLRPLPHAYGFPEPRMFLHVFPLDEADLPPRWRKQGFEELDFAFGHYGAWAGGKCFATRVLPPYPIASVRTGQVARFNGDAAEWTGEFAFENSGEH